MASRKLVSSYDPLQDPVYMSNKMLEFFKEKLKQMHHEIVQKETEGVFAMIGAPNREPDTVDQGSNESLLREDGFFQEHDEHLRHNIEAALKRIDEGTYGYCEVSGEPIGLKRLLAVPYARYCLTSQNRQEQDKGKETYYS